MPSFSNVWELLKKRKQKLDAVIHILIDKEEIIKRIQKRQSEENRDDDNVDVLKSRIDVYLKETTPLIDLYKKKNILKTLDGMQAIESVSNDMSKSIDEI